ncbi:MAG: glycine cleavage system aminomethyltransferase GcvT [Rhodospirillales bacterium]|nr:glycine cleavage system aminomethyltransferase GcvT [Rhodospirillales bacterium]
MSGGFVSENLLSTPLEALHRSLGARMVPFAGYAMPVQYPAGIIAEHNQTRQSAALFDVSHMGQAKLVGAGAAAALEALVPGDILGLKPFRQRYTLLTTASGTIIDDLMVACLPEALFLVVNASRKAVDFAHMAAHLPAGVTLAPMPDRALLALQGPKAAAVMARLAPEAAALAFMGVAETRVAGHACLVSRSGYTGEDGFEISVEADAAEGLARALLAEPEVGPAGLGARDSLRLEAGLCLWGNDIDETTNAIEAGLVWTIAKRRRAGWDFLGGAALRDILASGPARQRIGILPEGRAPARAGTEILANGTKVGTVTSGGFAPTLGAPVAMGYVESGHAEIGTSLALAVRGQLLPARVAAMPFVPHRYIR